MADWDWSLIAAIAVAAAFPLLVIAAVYVLRRVVIRRNPELDRD